MDALAEKLKLGFPLLSDPGNAYARSLDLVFAVEPAVRDVYRTKGLDLSEYNGDESWELPVTAVFLCDEVRKVLYAWTESDYSRRPGSEVAGGSRRAELTFRCLSGQLDGTQALPRSRGALVCCCFSFIRIRKGMLD